MSNNEQPITVQVLEVSNGTITKKEVITFLTSNDINKFAETMSETIVLEF